MFTNVSMMSKHLDIALPCFARYLWTRRLLKRLVKLVKSSPKRMHTKFAETYSLKRIVCSNVLSTFPVFHTCVAAREGHARY